MTKTMTPCPYCKDMPVGTQYADCFEYVCDKDGDNPHRVIVKEMEEGHAFDSWNSLVRAFLERGGVNG